MSLDLYNKVRIVPREAQKSIQGGRLKGMTDINPMWRIKTLTEQFGVCGFGWKYEILKQWIEKADTGEMAAFININLYVNRNSEWSAAIPGTGGSSFVAQEKNGPYMSDECFKMALTDALSVACKALGIGADIYWEGDISRYDNTKSEQNKQSKEKIEEKKATWEQVKDILKQAEASGLKEQSLYDWLAGLADRKIISTKYYTTKNKGILWTEKDAEAVAQKLIEYAELPFR